MVDNNSNPQQTSEGKTATGWDKQPKPSEDTGVSSSMAGGERATDPSTPADGASQDGANQGEDQMNAPTERGQGGSGDNRQGADDRTQSTDR